MRDELTSSRVQIALSTNWVGRTYLYLPEASSTNDLLKDQVADSDEVSPPAGTVILTNFQSRGRGRMGRRWEAPPGSSLLFSLLVRPGWPADRLSWLTMISGLAVSEAVEEQTGLAVRLKWPNDGVIKQNDTWHKYCGILLEGSVAASGLIDYAIVGIGVNVNLSQDNLPPAHFPATSLLAAGQQPVSRLDLFTGILSQFEHHYGMAEQGISPHKEWQKRLIFMGRRVVVSRPGQEIHVSGRAEGVDAEGQLLVRDESGNLHKIAAGDVTLRAHLDSS